ncbi:CHAT domain-containing protein [Laspinema sp. A4]|uniref:CHAT domain-containing protein n=1 Tax=Laspinema sp. D2d TaxID=2953686 RepID=UPI0021BA68F5|nr:CHAT domain-containing protein [Laspinema sp. D2d]MCT7984591.1 CHAT domain-containing protein [Laspinema sp. D2d]
MKLIHPVLFSLIAVFTDVNLSLAQEISPAADGTGTQVQWNGNQYDIQGGTLSKDGVNLFHSFDKFGLNPGEISNFQSTPHLQNILGRIIGGNPSVINGLIQISGGNANLFLMNPAGILFGQNAQLNVSGDFFATTATGIGFDSNTWFNATGFQNWQELVGTPVQFAFDSWKPGSIANFGRMELQPGHALVLMGGTVLNAGILSSPGGNITLAAIPGQHRVRLSQSGHLLSLDLEMGTSRTLTGSGLASLPNPLSLAELLTGGTLDNATGVEVNADGTIALTGSGISLNAEIGDAIASGTLDVSDHTPDQSALPSITIVGDRVAVLDAAIDASGIDGGGTIRIGGDFQGNNTIPTATRTFVSANTIIHADGLSISDPPGITNSPSPAHGGRVIIWSDQTTRFYGQVTARGGSHPAYLSQNGGFVEISGQEFLDFQGTVNTLAPYGTSGILLLDPTNIEIVSSTENTANLSDVDAFADPDLGEPTAIAVDLINNATTHVILQASEDITFNTAIAIQTPGVGLTAEAGNQIAVYGNIQTNQGDITLTANQSQSGNGGLFIDSNAILSSNGGNITLTSNPGTNGIQTGEIISSGGDVSLTSSGDIEVLAIDASGGTNGSGGRIEINTGGFFRATGTLRDRLDIPTSLYTADANGNEAIVIRHGGDSETPFIVGDARTNGTVGGIFTGTEQLNGILLSSDRTQGNIAILSNFAPPPTGETQPPPPTGGTQPPPPSGGTQPPPPSGGTQPPPPSGGTQPPPPTGGTQPPPPSGGTQPPPPSGGTQPPPPSGGTQPPPPGGTQPPPPGGTQPPPPGGTQPPPPGGTQPPPPGGMQPPPPGGMQPPPPGGMQPPPPGGTQPPPPAGTQPPPPAGGMQPPPPGGMQPPPPPQQQQLGQVQPNGNLDLVNNPTPAIARPNGPESVSAPPILTLEPLSPPSGLGVQSPIALTPAGPNPSNPGAIGPQPAPTTPASQPPRENSPSPGGNLPPGPVAPPPIPMNVATITQSLEVGNVSNAVLQLDRLQDQQFANYLGTDLSQQPLQSTESIRDTLEKITQQTNTKPAIVYTLLLPEQLELVVVTTEGTPIRKTVPEATRQAILQAAFELRQQIANPRFRNTTQYLIPAQTLYRWLIAPIQEELAAQNIDTLLFSMDAGLRSLPIAALHDGEKFLIEQYAIALIPSISLTDMRYIPLRNSRVLAMGASQFTQLNPLPAVPLELSTIAEQLWQGQALLNESFTRTNLIAKRQEYPYQIIHLATHAEFNPGGQKTSFIQLWNEQLYLDELRTLGWNNPPVELLVLSACRTAVGDETAELGFAGLALAAGVKSALASLWYVSDEGTLALMTEFYQYLVESPIKAEALQEAQLSLLRGEVKIAEGELRGTGALRGVQLPADLAGVENTDLSHPYYWAGFTMIGSPW